MSYSEIEFVIRDNMLDLEFPLGVVIDEPLSFKIDGPVTLDQLREIMQKTDEPTGMTPAYNVFQEFVSEFHLGEKPPEHIERISTFLELAAWFEPLIFIWMEQWSQILGGSSEVPVGAEVATEEDRIDRILSKVESLGESFEIQMKSQKKVEKHTKMAAIASKGTLNLKQAAHRIGIAERKLTGFVTDQATHADDPKALNGVWDGRLWKFQIEEVDRFRKQYWAEKAKEQPQAGGPEIRGRDA